ncbi:hypothetical protein CHM34_08015 [Paludifilum halophilum]|uniref:Uncharacterized protein n=1 Tax=Paludifilum halophilum TaxID=1642702 RepID=A0A235B7U0_9BACL|nr:hypothetical protein CHM34_08015 [Paludifilum halophilum]
MGTFVERVVAELIPDLCWETPTDTCPVERMDGIMLFMTSIPPIYRDCILIHRYTGCYHVKSPIVMCGFPPNGENGFEENPAGSRGNGNDRKIESHRLKAGWRRGKYKGPPNKKGQCSIGSEYPSGHLKGVVYHLSDFCHPTQRRI